MTPSSNSRTGVAAILAGALIFAGQVGQLVFGNTLEPVWVALVVLGIAALAVAIWGLRRLVSTRIGRIGWRIAVAGITLLGLFAVQTVITLALTGDIPENIGLFVFEGAWVALGVALLRAERRRQPDTASAWV